MNVAHEHALPAKLCFNRLPSDPAEPGKALARSSQSQKGRSMRTAIRWICSIVLIGSLLACDAAPEYVGELKDGKPNGQGKLTWPDGKTYFGSLAEGKREGLGTATWANGQKYVGEWKNDKRQGRGTVTWPSGEQYAGEFKNGKRHGRGTFTFAEGTTYVGDFKDGKPDGQGTFAFSDGTKHVGDFKDGRFSAEIIGNRINISSLNLLVLDPM
jgi:hypothetical protein